MPLISQCFVIRGQCNERNNSCSDYTDTIDKRLALLADGWQAINIYDSDFSAISATRLLVVLAGYYWH